MDRFESSENFSVGKIPIHSRKRKYVDYHANYYWREKGSLNGPFILLVLIFSFTVSRGVIDYGSN